MIKKSRKKRKGAGLFHYIKEAFLFRWNLLAFIGAAAAALISPSPDVLLPLVAAGELLYLAGLSAIPRFRAAVDAKVHARSKAPFFKGRDAGSARRALNEVLTGLEPEKRDRFQRLRHRCLYMQKIARGVRGRGREDTDHADDLRTPALDRLLWVFLRLLLSQQALERFLDSTDEAAIESRLDGLKKRHEVLKQGGKERMLRSLLDSMATAEMRLENYRKAEQNAEFVAVEIERIEGKIQAISEMAVSRQDPDFISSQVDSVTESMVHTEEAIRELNQITGLADEMEETPSILQNDLSREYE
jgi:hypothetical protein